MNDMDRLEDVANKLMAQNESYRKEHDRLKAENKRLTERVETLGRCLFSIQREIESVEVAK